MQQEKNFLTAQYYWKIKSSVVATQNCIEKYICILNTNDTKNKEEFWYIISLVPARYEEGIWHKTEMLFIPFAEHSPNLQETFFCLLDSVRNIEPYNFSLEFMETKLVYPLHCFSFDCLTVLFTLFYDYYFFEKSLAKLCKCGKFLSSLCVCHQLIPSALRSFYFVEKIY